MEEEHDAAANFAEEVPANVKSLIRHIGLLPELDNEGAEEMYDKVRNGNCMTCDGPLLEDTILLVNKRGIVGAYCGGPCMQDIAVMGYLQEQYEDIHDSINFRGGRGDAAPE